MHILRRQFDSVLFFIFVTYQYGCVGLILHGLCHPSFVSQRSIVTTCTDQLVSSAHSSPSPLLSETASTPPLFGHDPSHVLSHGVSLWLAGQVSEPSRDDIVLLRSAFAEFYSSDHNLDKSEKLLTQVIDRWQSQPPEELAGLYRVRGDCYMLMGEAIKAAGDYNAAIKLLDSPGGEAADPSELPAALLGRARAFKGLGKALSPSDATIAAADYKRALKLSSREEWDTEQELIEDGAARNPYAAWEWGSVLRLAGDWEQASKAHSLAAIAFDEIGDKARSAISSLDAGIDLAASDQANAAKVSLKSALQKTKELKTRDVALLQRVIAKEGEARMALASILWGDGQGGEAERVLGDACIELDQLQLDISQRSTSSPASMDESAAGKDTARPLEFSIDDDMKAASMSCSKFKDSSFLSKIGWPSNLQTKMTKLQTLR